MTIQEFARLCGCSAQTLRYYDRIDLLKPARVDPWSAYRYYDSGQAIDFVKIKNLQAADFSIREIKALLSQPDAQVYAAFETKISEQEQKLRRIRQIQQTWLSEKNAMEKIIHSMTDYLLGQCAHPEILPEFGLDPKEAPELLDLLRSYMNGNLVDAEAPQEVSMTINDEVIHGHEAVLSRIHDLTGENLTDTIQLSTGLGHSMEHTAEPDPDLSGFDCLWARRGWTHVREFLPDLPRLEPGIPYCLWLRTRDTALPDDLSFPLFLMAAVLRRQKGEDLTINCAISTAVQEENQFRLLRRREIE